MTTQTETLPGHLSSQLLALWPQWREADAAGRQRIKRNVSTAEAVAFHRLHENLRTAGEPSQWFGYASATAATKAAPRP